MAEKLMSMSAKPPKIFDFLELVKLPITFLLLQMCNIIAISTGAVTPYKIAE
jgi:hypothetical protein